MIALSFLNAYKNLVLLGVGAAFVAAVFFTGVKYEQRKDDAEIAAVNVPLAKQAGKDEAEVAANDEAGKATDAVVAGAIAQTCVLTPETVKMLAGLK